MIDRDPSSSVGGEEPLARGSSDASDVRALELDQLITDFFDAQREGRAPSVDDYVAEHPEHEHALRAVLPGASLLDRIGQRAEDASPQARSGDRLGEFKLLGILGRGGMGIVYEAVQESLGRPVALKVLPASRVLDRKSRERFLREAQAAASLQHPGIVAVHGVGEADGQVYYAMQRVDGVPLDVLIAAARGEREGGDTDSSALLERAAVLAARMRSSRLGTVEPSPRSGVSSASEATQATRRPWMTNAAEIALQVAEALSYAHSRGVVHRDIKPSNVMLDDTGRAYVTDFGLCKVADTSSLTAAGDVVGTLRYVPPERFGGRDDARGDVYGLGLILYEMLCGRAAFPQSDRAELVQAVTLQSPPRPRKINREIPEDLERIVLAASAKLPEERYASVEDLIADLRAFLDGRPIRARAPGKVYLAKLFLRRNRGLVGTAVVSIALLALGSALYIRDLRRVVGELEVARDAATRMAYHAQLGSAAQALESEKTSLAGRFLDEVPEESRDWVWGTLRARLDGARLVVGEGSAPILDLCLDEAESRLAVLREGSVRVHSLTTGALQAEVQSRAGSHVAFLPGADALLVVEGELGEIRVVVPSGGPPSEAVERFTRALEAANVTGVCALDSRGKHLAFALADDRVVVFEGARPNAPVVHASPAGRQDHVALFGGDGRVVHAARGEGAWVLGPEAGRVRRLPSPRSSSLIGLAGARDANSFVVLSEGARMARFIDDGDVGPLVAQGEVPIESGVREMVLSPDGRRVVTVTRIGRARLWTIELGATSMRSQALSSQPSAVLWPNGGEELVLGGDGGEWRAVHVPRYVQGFPGISRSRAGFSHTEALACGPDGEWAAIGETTGAWSIWNVDRRLPWVAGTDHLEPVRALALAVDDDGPSALAVGGQALRVWQRGREEQDSIPVLGPVAHLSWLDPRAPSPLIVAMENGVISRATEDGDGWRVVDVARVEGGVGDAVELPGTDSLLVGSRDGSLDLVTGLDPASGAAPTARRLVEFETPIVAVDVDHRGRFVAIVTEDQQLQLLDLDAARSTFSWTVQAGEPGARINAINAVAIDAGAGWVATVSTDGSLRTWSLADGRAGPVLMRLYNPATAIEFPVPGSPPVVLEFRGRLNHLELDSVDRSSGVPGLEPTFNETSAQFSLSSKARLDGAERALERADLAAHEAWAVWQLADALDLYSKRIRGEISRARARRVAAEAEKRYRDLQSAEAQ